MRRICGGRELAIEGGDTFARDLLRPHAIRIIDRRGNRREVVAARAGKIAKLFVNQAAAGIGRRKLVIERERTRVIRNGARIILLHGKRVSAVTVGERRAGIQPDRLVEVDDRAVVVALHVACLSTIDVSVCEFPKPYTP